MAFAQGFKPDRLLGTEDAGQLHNRLLKTNDRSIF